MNSSLLTVSLCYCFELQTTSTVYTPFLLTEFSNRNQPEICWISTLILSQGYIVSFNSGDYKSADVSRQDNMNILYIHNKSTYILIWLIFTCTKKHLMRLYLIISFVYIYIVYMYECSIPSGNLQNDIVIACFFRVFEHHLLCFFSASSSVTFCWPSLGDSIPGVNSSMGAGKNPGIFVLVFCFNQEYIYI